MTKVRTRFAPSPTGFLHIGSLRTALYAYALAKHYNGEFLLRIEDTDQKREVKGSTQSLQKTLKTFSLLWDEFYIQSERHKTGIYREKAEQFINDDHAFYCRCKAKNSKDGNYSNILRDPCRDKGYKSGAVKLKVPDNSVLEYVDFVHRKKISWKTNDVYDATLLKSDGFPTYHLAAMVDDVDMKITHILRGHDWLPSTPIHLLVFEYLGSDQPEIGHLTDILSAQTGKKLSKRRDSVFVEDFLKMGYLPDALLNFVMLLGWAPKDNREFYTLDEFVDNFNERGFGDANPKFFKDKLDWMNSQYIQKMNDNLLTKKLSDFYVGKFDSKIIERIVPLVKSRIKTLAELEDLAGFFFKNPEVDKKLLGSNSAQHLTDAKQTLTQVNDWRLEDINEALTKMINVKKYKTGDFYMDFRIAITGNKQTPPINESIVILGKDKTLDRIDKLL